MKAEEEYYKSASRWRLVVEHSGKIVIHFKASFLLSDSGWSCNYVCLRLFGACFPIGMKLESSFRETCNTIKFPQKSFMKNIQRWFALTTMLLRYSEPVRMRCLPCATNVLTKRVPFPRASFMGAVSPVPCTIWLWICDGKAVAPVESDNRKMPEN